MMENICRVFDW